MQRSWLILGKISFWLSWPLSYMMLRGSQRTRALLIFNNEILLVRTWLSGGKWGLPGGGLHRHETPLAGVQREVLEEVGLTLPADSCQALGRYVFNAYGLPFDCQLYAVSLAQKPTVKRQRLEIAAIQWQSLDRLSAKDTFPDVFAALQRYRR